MIRKQIKWMTLISAMKSLKCASEWIWQQRWSEYDSGGQLVTVEGVSHCFFLFKRHILLMPAPWIAFLCFDRDTKSWYTVFAIFTTLDIWQYIYNISKYHKISQNTSNCVHVVPFFMNQSGNASLMCLHWSDLNLMRMMLPPWTCWVGWRLEWTGRAFKQWDEPELGAHL